MKIRPSILNTIGEFLFVGLLGIALMYGLGALAGCAAAHRPVAVRPAPPLPASPDYPAMRATRSLASGSLPPPAAPLQFKLVSTFPCGFEGSTDLVHWTRMDIGPDGIITNTAEKLFVRGINDGLFTWGSVSNATGYRIWQWTNSVLARCTDVGLTLSASIPLLPGPNECRITAYCAIAESDWSDPVFKFASTNLIVGLTIFTNS